MNIGIVSLGLIGGSILKKLSKSKKHKLVAVTRNPESIKKALLYTDYASDDINTLKDCEIVFVCSPMNKTVEILHSLEKVLNKDTIVTDVSSLKEFVCKEEYKYTFIGSHPMAGTEHSGFDASFEELFEDAKWIITTTQNTKQSDKDILSEIIKETGATILETTPQEHDKAAALISHMPMLVAQALMKTVLNNELALKMASSGFRDMTRLATSNTEMANDMIKMNSQNISDSTINLMETIKTILNDDYNDQIEHLKEFRENMYSKTTTTGGKNIL